MDEMPLDVQTASVAIQEAYQFASINPDVMKDIPCYCGCGDIGHASNYACYVSNVDDRGNLTTNNWLYRSIGFVMLAVVGITTQIKQRS